MPTTMTSAKRSDVRLKIEALRAWQGLKGWNDLRLARELGVSQAMLSRIMTGDRNPGGKFIGGLLKASECPFEAFFEVRG